MGALYPMECYKIQTDMIQILDNLELRFDIFMVILTSIYDRKSSEWLVFRSSYFIIHMSK